MRLRTALLLVFAIGFALPAEPQIPTPVVEKITTHLGTITRVSLFSNRLIVVSVRSDTDNFVHHAEIGPDDYMVYLQTLEYAAENISNYPVSSGVESEASTTTMILHVGPDAPITFTYSPLASLDLSLGRIASVVEDLRIQALEALPGAIELSHWEPQIGDCVELRAGGIACVIFVEEDGTVVLRRDDIVITYTVTEEERADTILKLIEPES